MEKTQVNIEKIEVAGNTLVVRTGEAAKIKEYKPINVSGNIYAPYEFFARMILTEDSPSKIMSMPFYGKIDQLERSLVIPEMMRINPGNCIVIANSEKRTLKLIVNPMDPEFKITVEGTLKESKQLIDSKVYYGKGSPSHLLRADFVKHLRYNSYLFEQNEAYHTAVHKMNSLIVKIETEVQESQDNHGNKKSMYEKKVGDIGLTPLKMKFILFDGSETSVDLTVEINYEVINDRLNFFLDCPSLGVIMEAEYKSTIAKLIENFKSKNVPVIEGESASIS